MVDYFGEDGPEAIPNVDMDAEEKAFQVQQSKEKYVKYFLIDMMEINLRKVVAQNTIFCANKCNLLDNVMDDDPSPADF